MSTPDQPDTPQLTRRQLRELRNTASTPIITPEEAAANAASVAAPLPRAAEPLPAERPAAAEDVDLGAPALTRRAARQQERLRTASVPVIDGAQEGEDQPSQDGEPGEDQDVALSADETPSEPDAGDDGRDDASDDGGGEDAAGGHADDDTAADHDTADDSAPEVTPEEIAETADDLAEAQSEAPDIEVSDDEAPPAASAAPDRTGEDEEDDPAPRAVVAPSFGSGLLAGEGVELELPASFDQLLTRGNSSTGSLGASNALILSQTPDTGAFVSPIASTGEVLVTGTYNLPESFGSTGTSRGSSDGKEIDAILMDGELPATSSPTPIAASAAISTIKSAEDIIRPPAPEKGSRLMIALGITAGALALALMGVLIVALFTGAFQ